MEPSTRSKRADMLCAEVTQTLEVLEQMLTAQGLLLPGPLYPSQGPP